MDPIVNQQANVSGVADPNVQVSPEQMAADQAYMEQMQQQVPGAMQQQQPQQGMEQPAGNYITREDLNAILAQRESEIIRRASQSATDKVSARVNERLAALEMNKTALGLSEEQIQKAKNNIIQEEMGNQTPAQANQVDSGQPSPAEQEILGIMSEIFSGEGIEVLSSDPEGKIIQDAIMDPNMTPYKLRKAVMNATMQKSQRMQAKTSGMQSPPAGGPPSKNTNSMSTSQLWDSAYKK